MYACTTKAYRTAVRFVVKQSSLIRGAGGRSHTCNSYHTSVDPVSTTQSTPGMVYSSRILYRISSTWLWRCAALVPTGGVVFCWLQVRDIIHNKCDAVYHGTPPPPIPQANFQSYIMIWYHVVPGIHSGGRGSNNPEVVAARTRAAAADISPQDVHHWPYHFVEEKNCCAGRTK